MPFWGGIFWPIFLPADVTCQLDNSSFYADFSKKDFYLATLDLSDLPQQQLAQTAQRWRSGNGLDANASVLFSHCS